MKHIYQLSTVFPFLSLICVAKSRNVRIIWKFPLGFTKPSKVRERKILCNINFYWCQFFFSLSLRCSTCSFIFIHERAACVDNCNFAEEKEKKMYLGVECKAQWREDENFISAGDFGHNQKPWFEFIWIKWISLRKFHPHGTRQEGSRKDERGEGFMILSFSSSYTFTSSFSGFGKL